MKTAGFNYIKLIFAFLFCIPSLILANDDILSPKNPILINWQDSSQDFLRIRHYQNRGVLKQCLDSGFKLVFSYRLEICKHRGLWFDPCLKELSYTKELSYEPLQQVFTLKEVSNVSKETDVKEYDETKAAFDNLLTLANLELNKISLGSLEYRRSKRSYISINVNGVCSGRSEDLSEAIAGLLTLGMFNFNEYESGWTDFRLYTE